MERRRSGRLAEPPHEPFAPQRQEPQQQLDPAEILASSRFKTCAASSSKKRSRSSQAQCQCRAPLRASSSEMDSEDDEEEDKERESACIFLEWRPGTLTQSDTMLLLTMLLLTMFCLAQVPVCISVARFVGARPFHQTWVRRWELDTANMTNSHRPACCELFLPYHAVGETLRLSHVYLSLCFSVLPVPPPCCFVFCSFALCFLLFFSGISPVAPCPTRHQAGQQRGCRCVRSQSVWCVGAGPLEHGHARPTVPRPRDGE